MAVAVITGAHPIDVAPFQDAVTSVSTAPCYFQSIYEFAAEPAAVRHGYEAVVFYHWHLPTPEPEPAEWWQRGVRQSIEELGTGQGIVVLHHSLVAFPDWPVWDRLCGFSDRTFTYHQGQDFHVNVVDRANPATFDVDDFDIRDETYLMRSPDEGRVTPLLQVDHPLSMRTIAWHHEVGKSRVFCLQLGHDAQAYANRGFRRVLQSGLTWSKRVQSR